MTLLDNLVSYWKLDEASGTRNDSHGTNHLTDDNTVTTAAALLGANSAHFVAANSEDLSIADNGTLGFTAALSMSFWIKQTDLAVNRAFIGKWTYATDGEWVIQSGSATSPDITVFLAVNAGDDGSLCRMDFNDADMTAGAWYHVVLVYDGSLVGNANRLKLWVNGTAKTLTAGSGNVPASLRDGTATFYLGRFGGSLTRYYNGDMDEVGLWNRAITSAEVSSLYGGGAGLAYSAFVPPAAQAAPARAPASVGHGQLGLASGLRTFLDLVALDSE